MTGSTNLLQFLKALSVAGIALNAIAFAVILIFGLVMSKAMARETFWVLLWGTLAVGMPISGILYATLKAREYLRDIAGALAKK